jgi:RNA polymerase sigma-70 factor, ECF subfamily
MSQENPVPNPLDFDAIYTAFYARILRYLTRLAGPDEAEDISQEVFSKISRSLAGVRSEASLSTWVYRIATNAAMDRVRSAGFRASASAESLSEAGDVQIAESVPSAEQQLIRAEMSECVRGLVRQLPADYRTVLVLSDMEGLKGAEIAEVLGASLQTVKMRLHRARVRLKMLMEERCTFYRNEEDTLLCDRKETPAGEKNRPQRA